MSTTRLVRQLSSTLFRRSIRVHTQEDEALDGLPGLEVWAEGVSEVRVEECREPPVVAVIREAVDLSWLVREADVPDTRRTSRERPDDRDLWNSVYRGLGLRGRGRHPYLHFPVCRDLWPFPDRDYRLKPG